MALNRERDACISLSAATAQKRCLVGQDGPSVASSRRRTVVFYGAALDAGVDRTGDGPWRQTIPLVTFLGGDVVFLVVGAKVPIATGRAVSKDVFAGTASETATADAVPCPIGWRGGRDAL